MPNNLKVASINTEAIERRKLAMALAEALTEKWNRKREKTVKKTIAALKAIEEINAQKTNTENKQ